MKSYWIRVSPNWLVVSDWNPYMEILWEDTLGKRAICSLEQCSFKSRNTKDSSLESSEGT